MAPIPQVEPGALQAPPRWIGIDTEQVAHPVLLLEERGDT